MRYASIAGIKYYTRREIFNIWKTIAQIPFDEKFLGQAGMPTISLPMAEDYLAGRHYAPDKIVISKIGVLIIYRYENPITLTIHQFFEEYRYFEPEANNIIELTEKEWYALFNPIYNPEEEGSYYFNERSEALSVQNEKHLWTFIDGENEDQFILSGDHWVNRFAYAVTEIPPFVGLKFQVNWNEMISKGEAKYKAIEFIEDHLGISDDDPRMDDIHDFFNQ